MRSLEMLVLLLLGVLASAVLVGRLIARARMRAVRAVQIGTPCVRLGIPASPTRPSGQGETRRRRSRLLGHDYDRWIGRTLYR